MKVGRDSQSLNFQGLSTAPCRFLRIFFILNLVIHGIIHITKKYKKKKERFLNLLLYLCYDLIFLKFLTCLKLLTQPLYSFLFVSPCENSHYFIYLITSAVTSHVHAEESQVHIARTSVPLVLL